MMAHEDVHNGVSLAELLSSIATVPSVPMVTDITLDSRAVTQGAAFLACPGISSHGLQYVDRALAAGARVVLWEPQPNIEPPRMPPGVVGLAIPELRGHL